jgi:hypothetical protein
VFVLGIGTAAVLARGSRPAPTLSAVRVPPPSTALVNQPPKVANPSRSTVVEAASVVSSEHVRRQSKGHQAVRPAVAVAPQSAPPTKKSKADDKIAPSPYTEPKAP